MSPARTKRAAEVGLVALHRAWVTEGEFALSRTELADRMGYKSAEQLEQPMINYLIGEGWIAERPEGFLLTEAGRAHSASKLFQDKQR